MGANIQTSIENGESLDEAAARQIGSAGGAALYGAVGAAACSEGTPVASVICAGAGAVYGGSEGGDAAVAEVRDVKRRAGDLLDGDFGEAFQSNEPLLAP